MDPRTPTTRTPFARRRSTVRMAALGLSLALTGAMAAAPVLAATAPATTAASTKWPHVPGRLATGPDVTARARAQSVKIGGLWHTVTRWRGACIASEVPEALLAASQRALGAGQLSGARALLDASRTAMHNEAHRHLVSAHRYSWFATTEQRIARTMPRYGHLHRGAHLPGAPSVLRCNGASPDASPSNARAAQMRAAGDDSFLSTPSTEDVIHSAVAVALGAVPEIAGAATGAEIPGVVGGVLSELANLFWPSPTPAAPPVDAVTWNQMTTYVQNEINQAVDQINQVIAANRVAELEDDLTALHTQINTYTTDLDNLTPAPGTFGGYSDVDRARAFALYSTLDGEFTSILPHFTDDPTSYLNLPETINLYTLYMTTLRGWILTADTFNSDPTAAAKWKAAREADLAAVIAKATSVVNAQLPQLEATQPAGRWALDQGWNKHWSFMDAITPAGYDQVWLWKYMDPVAYPPNPTTGRISAPSDPEVLATPCYGSFTAINALSPLTGFPSQADPTQFLEPQLTDTSQAAGASPLSKIDVFGSPTTPSEITGIQLTYANGSKGPVQGDINAISTAGTTTAPLGGTVQLGPTTSGFVTRVSGTYTPESVGVNQNNLEFGQIVVPFGGTDHVQFTTTLNDASGKAVSTTGPMIPDATSPTSYDVSFPGYVLSWIGLPQYTASEPFTNGWGDECIAYGFRLQDSY